MLCKSNRLVKRRDFEALSRSGRPIHSQSITIRFQPNHSSALRIGIAVSLKVSKRATVRNLIRRRIREVFRRHLPSIQGGYNIAVYVKPAAIGRSYKLLAVEIGSLLNRAKILRSSWVDILGKQSKSIQSTSV
ncbi:MAG: ribonuclease P protein component [Candidatus Uhrbacteria bacterium]